MNCQICQTVLVNRQKNFCSGSCKTISWQRRNGILRKRKLIDLKGGKCSICGYNKNLAALAFHHQTSKNFGIDLGAFTSKSWISLLKEAEKCIVVCHNCHMEIHYPHLNDC